MKTGPWFSIRKVPLNNQKGHSVELVHLLSLSASGMTST